MREALEQLNSQLWIILHHRWLALICAFVICAVGWTVVKILPDQYQVEAKFFFDTKTVLKPLLQGLAVDSSVKEESITLIKRTLTSRPNLVKVAQDTELDITATTPKETEELLSRLKGSINIDAVSISGSKRNSDDIYNITYTSPNPETAKKVVDSLLNIFVESLLGISRKDSDKAEKFLDEKIAEYRKKLEEAEDKIKIFKQKNAGLTPETGSSFYSRLYAAEAKLDEALLNLREEKNKNASLKEQLMALEKQSADDPGEMLPLPPREKTQLEKRIEAMKLKLDELELQYTDRHPDVITTRNALNELMAQQEAEENSQEDTPEGKTRKRKVSSIQNSDLYQELNIMLSSSNSEIAAINARIDEYRNKIEEMKALVNVMPEVEARMKSLVRNYEILKETYDNLVQRRASAQISREAEQTGSEFQFNIIEPPRIPLEPVSPNRLLLATAVLVIGVLGGAALAWVYEQLKPTYYQQQELEEDLELPVYGGVSMFWSPQEISRRKAGISFFILLYIVLFSAYVLMMFHYGLGDKAPDQIRELLGL